jgi:hypothetical protein
MLEIDAALFGTIDEEIGGQNRPLDERQTRENRRCDR